MPIYGYKCERGHAFEVRQRFSDEPLTSCQVCGAPVHKVLYPVSVHFKGSGFYNTDYGTKRRAREAKEHKEAQAAASSSDSKSGSDSKSESGSKSESTTSSAGSESKSAQKAA